MQHTIEDLSNGIKNTSMRVILTSAIELWSCGSPGGLQVPTFGSVSLILTLASKWGCDIGSASTFLSIYFFGGHARKSMKSILFTRFWNLLHGYDLLEGNIHEQDMPFSELEMPNASGRPSIQVSPFHPTPPWGKLLELHALTNHYIH
jgi:hypothetical protein